MAAGPGAPPARSAYRRGMAEWWSIEVFHGELAAGRWRDAYASRLIESAVTAGATSWEWHEHQFGVVFEVEFGDEADWAEFRAIPTVQAALDAVPDPVNGLLIYQGRGGGAGAGSPRRPRPAAGAGAISLPEPGVEPRLDLTAAEPPDPVRVASAV
jgi:hypothetical protein